MALEPSGNEKSTHIAGMTLFAVSLALHSSALFSIDRMWSKQEKILETKREVLSRKEEPVQFEFVEAPPKTQPKKPEVTKKVSDRDALNQDLTKDKTAAEVSPHLEAQGPSDQLAQVQGARPQPQSLPVQPSPSQDEIKPEEKKIERQEDVVKQVAMMDVESPDTEIIKAYQEKRKPQDASSAVNPLPGLTGQDKITTQAMARAQSRGAALFGATSFEATGSGMGEYMKNLKEKIWLAWFPYLAFQYPQDFRGADAVISFTLNAKGEVKIVRILESEGSPLFSAFCVESIQRAGNFGPVPQELLALLGKDELEIRFGFHYR